MEAASIPLASSMMLLLSRLVSAVPSTPTPTTRSLMTHWSSWSDAWRAKPKYQIQLFFDDKLFFDERRVESAEAIGVGSREMARTRGASTRW